MNVGRRSKIASYIIPQVNTNTSNSFRNPAMLRSAFYTTCSTCPSNSNNGHYGIMKTIDNFDFISAVKMLWIMIMWTMLMGIMMSKMLIMIISYLASDADAQMMMRMRDALKYQFCSFFNIVQKAFDPLPPSF